MDALRVFDMRISDVLATEHLHRHMRTHGHRISQLCHWTQSPQASRFARPACAGYGLDRTSSSGDFGSYVMAESVAVAAAAFVVSSAHHLLDKPADSLHLEGPA